MTAVAHWHKTEISISMGPHHLIWCFHPLIILLWVLLYLYVAISHGVYCSLFFIFYKSIPFIVRERETNADVMSKVRWQELLFLTPMVRIICPSSLLINFPSIHCPPHPLAHMCCDLVLFLKDWLTSNGNNQSTFRSSARAGFVKCPSTHTVPHQLIFKEMPKLVIIYMQSTCFCAHHYILTYFLTSN